MNKFIVNTAILTPKMDPKTCAANAPHMLQNAGIKDVKLVSCYCCSAEGRDIFVAEGPNKDVVLAALDKINVPVASILETEMVK
jgi:hypothetical protein